MSAWLVARGNNDPGGNHLMLLRRFRPEDLPELADLFVDTIRRVNCRDYSRNRSAYGPPPVTALPEILIFFCLSIRLSLQKMEKLSGMGTLTTPDIWTICMFTVNFRDRESPHPSARSWSGMRTLCTRQRSQSMLPSPPDPFSRNGATGFSENSRWNVRAYC